MNDECYVYIVLPGETEFVTAGKFVLATDRHGVATGKFIYGRSYRARENAVAIDPFELKLCASTFETQRLRALEPRARRARDVAAGARVRRAHGREPTRNDWRSRRIARQTIRSRKGRCRLPPCPNAERIDPPTT